MTDPEVLERITVRRAELDGLEEQLVKQLADERAAAGSPVVQVAGRAVRLVLCRVLDFARSRYYA